MKILSKFLPIIFLIAQFNDAQCMFGRIVSQLRLTNLNFSNVLKNYFVKRNTRLVKEIIESDSLEKIILQNKSKMKGQLYGSCDKYSFSPELSFSLPEAINDSSGIIRSMNYLYKKEDNLFDKILKMKYLRNCKFLITKDDFKTLKDIQLIFEKLKHLMNLPEKTCLKFCIPHIEDTRSGWYDCGNKNIYLNVHILYKYSKSYALFVLIHELCHARQDIYLQKEVYCSSKCPCERNADVKAFESIRCPLCIKAYILDHDRFVGSSYENFKYKNALLFVFWKIFIFKHYDKLFYDYVNGHKDLPNEDAYLTKNELLCLKKLKSDKDLCDFHKNNGCPNTLFNRLSTVKFD